MTHRSRMQSESARALTVQWIAAAARPVLALAIVFGGQLDRVSHRDWTTVDAVTAAISAWAAAQFAHAHRWRDRAAIVAAAAFAVSAGGEVAVVVTRESHLALYVANLAGLVGLTANLRAVEHALDAVGDGADAGLAHVIMAMFGIIAAVYAVSLGSGGFACFAGIGYMLLMLVYPATLGVAARALELRERRLPHARIS
jgi:hypothetical protein|nr:hypothetical protein [Kofleriaceae bacterium]